MVVLGGGLFLMVEVPLYLISEVPMYQCRACVYLGV